MVFLNILLNLVDVLLRVSTRVLLNILNPKVLIPMISLMLMTVTIVLWLNGLTRSSGKPMRIVTTKLGGGVIPRCGPMLMACIWTRNELLGPLKLCTVTLCEVGVFKLFVRYPRYSYVPSAAFLGGYVILRASM